MAIIVSLAIAILYSTWINGVAAEKNRAFFIFGDSSVDSGNNNFIETIPENKANYKPYGRNGFFKTPTGRFSDGRIVVDYLAEYAELPLIPPFLDPSADLSYGVNFASGGGGILPTTNEGQAIDLKTQLKYFEEVEQRLTAKFGGVEAKEILSNAIYFLSIGSNDYLGGYLGNPEMQQLHPPEQYVGMVVGNLTVAIQELYGKGARKFGFLGLSSLGCLPVMRAVNPNANAIEGGCFEEANSLALAHNNALKNVLTNLQHLLKDFKYSNSDFYTWLLDRINNPSNYGFEEGKNACCGTGPFRGIFSCGGTKKVTDYDLCDNGDDYVWWDSFHPTEKIHQQFARDLWDGTRAVVGPYSLRDLFGSPNTIADIVDVDQENNEHAF